MRLFRFLLLVLPLSLPLAAAAQPTPVVVELFTSQGCSSCPPADEILGEIADRPGVIALALHVDYWDYLGWRDRFGQAAHSKRQRSYAKAARERSIYTPQMIVQGADRVVGADHEAVEGLIEAHQALPQPVALQIDRVKDRLRIRLAPRGTRGVGAADIHVVRYLPSAEVEITAGENAGRTFPYANVVTDWTTVARWDGRSEAELEVEAPEGHLAVIVQRDRFGPVLSAARLP